MARQRPAPSSGVSAIRSGVGVPLDVAVLRAPVARAPWHRQSSKTSTEDESPRRAVGG